MEEGECSEDSNQASDISSTDDFDDCVVVDENVNSNVFQEENDKHNNITNDASLMGKFCYLNIFQNFRKIKVHFSYKKKSESLLTE